MSVDALKSRETGDVLEEIRVITAEAHELGQGLLSTSREIEHWMEVAFRTVYKHDTWTCPVTVQHALQEICRAYGDVWWPLQNAFGRVAYSFTLYSPGSMRIHLQELAATTEQEFALPDLRELEVYFDQIKAYLSSDSGPLTRRMRRQWDPEASSELRVTFSVCLAYVRGLTFLMVQGPAGNPRFDASWMASVPHDVTCLDHLTAAHIGLERALRSLKPLMQRWMNCVPLFLSSDNQFLLPVDQVQEAQRLTWDLEEFLARDVFVAIETTLGELTFSSGWTLGRVPADRKCASQNLFAVCFDLYDFQRIS